MNRCITAEPKFARWLPVCAGVLLLAAAPAALGWNVYNLTQRRMFAEVYTQAGDRTWVQYIDPNPAEPSGCHYTDNSCNPGQNPLNELLLYVKTTDGIADYVCRVTLQAGGYAQIQERDRGVMGAPTELYVVTFTASSQVFDFDSWDYERGWTNRHVRFLVAGDCQYSFSGTTQAETDKANANAVHQHLHDLKYSGRHVRGIIYAGDLTQSTAMDEWDYFKRSVASFERYLFHGLGNHDVSEPTDGQTAWCEYWKVQAALGQPVPSRSGCVDPDEIHEHVLDLKRATRKTRKGNPHYSWDWHDVHFVQLNLFPGNQAPSALPDGPLPPNTEYRDHDPMGALTFLMNDLAASVGDSGRPVVLIHHYGFDGFSKGEVALSNVYEVWWTERQRMACWAALQGYNVAGIFTGHLHLDSADTDWVIHWKPTNAITGDPIPTFISAASLNRVFLDVEILSNDRMTVTRKNAAGTALTNVTVCLNRTVRYANAAHGGPRDGTALHPFQRVGDAVNALGTISSECAAKPEVQLRAGHYAEPIRITRQARLTARGGVARVGP
jgi:hypothetical protein